MNLAGLRGAAGGGRGGGGGGGECGGGGGGRRSRAVPTGTAGRVVGLGV